MASAAPPAASSSTASTSHGLDTAKLLVQKIARTFYGNRAAILVDQLVQRECFRDEEIARRLGMQIKDITKIAHRLVEDQVVQVHRRSEMRDNGMMKAQQRAYYFLDYSKATDVIKWRMWRIQQTIDVKLRNELDAQGYVCPLCKASYSHLDAATLFDPTTNLLRCSVCHTEVTNKENEDDVRGNKDRMQRLIVQTKGIVDLLKKMDKVTLPRFNIESYLAIHGPALGATAHAAASASGSLPAQAAVVTVQIAGDDDEANELRRRAQEIEDKRNQNALPSWIAQSTISSAPEQAHAVAGAGAGAGAGEREAAPGEARDGVQGASSAARVGGATLRMGDGGDRKPVLAGGGAHAGSDPAGAGATGDADLDAYYASLESGAAGGAAQGASGEATPALDGDDGYGDDDDLEGSPLLDSPGRDVAGARAGTSEERDLGLEEADEGTPGAAAAATSGKREREGEGEDEDELGAASSKRVRRDDEDRAGDGLAATGDQGDGALVQEEEEGEDDDEFDLDEGGEGGGDPNQLIMVNGKEMPFSKVTEDMTGDMTADEYSAYWEVYQQVNS
ncbi:uncharacterized protein RHOBADRAFT_53452 [Rhodotorula graminis WP1]|uniref:HTH TFE/IIEalpha-type domain-containing protein n=1 Tax=Rhodotorula graminis (strain WP1) TaxID=578459 RepID=A0A194S4P0_RHOGW|nr:uncharacterized protein RHOBADRAFT_53452 [Rhodotorula graminis WP1]KPV75480.1 hypothetical protein RHOBADRAFT_53452 [Rhodotorula graminis WP1]